jgi:hypothetical protein
MTLANQQQTTTEAPRAQPPIDFAALMEPVALRLLGEPTEKHRGGLEWRYGTHGSLKIESDKGTFYDFEANVGGGVLDLIALKTGSEGMDWLRIEGFLDDVSVRATRLAKPKPKPVAQQPGTVVATYDYVDERGDLLFQVVRYQPKSFRQRRADHNTWIWNLDGVRRVLYRLPDLIKAVANGQVIYITEGEKDCDGIRDLGCAATTCSGGAKKWMPDYNDAMRGADVILLPDNDDAGREHAEQVAVSLSGIAKRVRVLDIAKIWPECPEKGDISDWIAASGTADKLAVLVNTLPDWREAGQSPNAPRLRPLTLAELFLLEIKPREMVLDPILPQKGLAMLYASRGTGKTHLALGIGYAVAAGTKFLKWNAPKARRVLLVDGEMPAATLRERLASIVAGNAAEAAPDMFKILAGDLIEDGGVGNLASPTVQTELEPWLEGIDLLILDNLSSLTAVIRDNDADSWNPIQAWLLRLRRRGISVIIVHHAGKGGEQRGTSRREDVLDTSISLRRPNDYVPTEGARFEIHLEKARGVHGDNAKPFEALLEVRDGATIWTTREIEDVNLARVKALLDDGLSVRDIADETGISKSTVHRLKKKAGGADGTD